MATAAPVLTPEVTVLPKRPCKFCGREIYLQYMNIPNLNYVAFEYPGNGLHFCIMRPLDSGTKQLILQKLEEDMNTESTDNDTTIMELIRRIDVMVWNLNQIKGKIADLKIKSNSDNNIIS